MQYKKLKKTFITNDLRPKVSGQYYDPTPPEYYTEVLNDINMENITTLDTRKRREIIIRLLRAKFLPEDIEYKLLLKDIFYKLLKQLP